MCGANCGSRREKNVVWEMVEVLGFEVERWQIQESMRRYRNYKITVEGILDCPAQQSRVRLRLAISKRQGLADNSAQRANHPQSLLFPSMLRNRKARHLRHP